MVAAELIVTDLAFGLMLGCVFSVVAHGLNMIWGVVKVVNIAHGEFIMLGAYGAYFLNLFAGLTPLETAPIDAPASDGRPVRLSAGVRDESTRRTAARCTRLHYPAGLAGVRTVVIKGAGP